MSYHVVAYTVTSFNASNVDMTPAADAILAISNGHYLPQSDLYLYGGVFTGTLMNAIRLVTPRSRQVVPPPLYPINGATLMNDRPHIFDRRSNPFKLNAVEEVSMQVNVGGTANALATAIMFWGQGITPAPAGDVFALHGTSTTAAVSLSWTQIAVTWDQTIPAGTYAVIGSQHQSTNALAHRFIFRDLQQVLRPGFASINALANISEPSYYFGGWGVLGTFNTYTYPNIEVFVNGTDNSHDVVMNIVRIG